MANNLLGCGHPEDLSARREFYKPGDRKTVYLHQRCTQGHVTHFSPPRIIVPKGKPGPLKRIESFCPVCSK